jgi:colanic acid biosynthesis glycosyl transferase WcaI
MKILLHAINYAPELTGIGKYLGEQAVWLAGQGHEVRVVTAPPYYPEWFVSGEFQGVRYKVEHRNGVKVYRCPLYVPATPSGLKRIVHLLSFAVSSFPVMLRQIFWRPDVVMVVEPPLFCAPAAWLTARLSGAKCWLHIQDYEVDAAFGLGLVRGEWLRRLVLACERWLYRRFDRVSSISGNMLKRLGGKGVASDKQYLFPNWVDITQIIPLQGDNPLRLELGIPPEKSIALYSGNMGD